MKAIGVKKNRSRAGFNVVAIIAKVGMKGEYGCPPIVKQSHRKS